MCCLSYVIYNPLWCKCSSVAWGATQVTTYVIKSRQLCNLDFCVSALDDTLQCARLFEQSGDFTTSNTLLINERRKFRLRKEKNCLFHICFMFLFIPDLIFARTVTKPKASLILKGCRQPSQTNSSVPFLMNAAFFTLQISGLSLVPSAAISSVSWRTFTVSHWLLADRQPEQVLSSGRSILR